VRACGRVAVARDHEAVTVVKRDFSAK
jgi:hypothetical protein